MQRGNSVRFHPDTPPATSNLERGGSVRFGSTYRLLKVPSAKALSTARKFPIHHLSPEDMPRKTGKDNNNGGHHPITDVQRPVWFYVEVQTVEGGTCRESKGPYTIEDLRQKWMEGVIDGDTMVWTADKPYFDWEPIDSVSHRRLKEALLRPLLPALPGSQRDGLKDNDTADDLDDDDEDDFHRPDPLRVVDVANVCSECGVVASVHCRQCKDNRTEVLNGLANRVGSLANAAEIIPGFLWMGDNTAAARSVVNELGITHIINTTEELPNQVKEDFQVTAENKEGEPEAGPDDNNKPNELTSRLVKSSSFKKLGRMRDRVIHKEKSNKSLSPSHSSRSPRSSSPKLAANNKRGTKSSPRLSGTPRKKGRSPTPRSNSPKQQPKEDEAAATKKPAYHENRRVSHMQMGLGNVGGKDNLTPYFDKLYDYIEMIRQQNLGRSIRPQGKGAPQAATAMAQYRVLIVSGDGRCRAPAAVMSYLIRAWGFSYEQAYKIVITANPNVELTLDAMGKLMVYSEQYGLGRPFCHDCFQEHHGHLTDQRGVPSLQLLNEAGVSKGRKAKAWANNQRLAKIDCSGEVFHDPDKALGFCRALAEVRLTLGMTSLDLTGVGLGDAGLRSLTESFLMSTRPCLTALCLGSNRLSDEGLAVLINTLNFGFTGKDRIKLIHLDLSNNLSEIKTCQAVYDYLKDEDCMLSFLSLRGNAMRDQSVVKVVDALSPPEFHELLMLGNQPKNGPSSIERPVLKANRPTDSEKWSFDLALQGQGHVIAERQRLANSSLTSLDLGCNELGSAAYHRLKHAVRDHKTLCQLSLGGSSHPENGQEELSEFLRYLAIYPSELQYLDLSRMTLDDQSCDAVARVMGEESCRVMRLDVSYNAFTAGGFKAFAGSLLTRNRLAVVSGRPIMSLDLSSNPIGSEGVVALAEVFLKDDKRKMAMEELEVSGCSIGADGFVALAKVLEMPQCPLRFLNLNDNKKGGLEGVTAISHALTINKGLVRLNMASTGVTMEGAKSMAHCLRDNRTLLELDLSRNEMRDVGAKAFAQVFQREENHTLRILDLSFTKMGDEGVNSLYSALLTKSESSRDMKVRDLHLALTGNHATLDLNDYAPDLDHSHITQGYDTMIIPNLAKSKQTLAFAGELYTDPALDTSMWSRQRDKMRRGSSNKSFRTQVP